MTVLQGKVANVYKETSGDTLVGDYLTGDTLLTLNYVTDFSEVGGQVLINNEIYTYLTMDPVAKTITLSSGLVANAFETDDVSLYPESSRLIAEVQQSDSGSITVPIAHDLRDRVTEGIRDEDTAEQVVMNDANGKMLVTEFPDRQPSIIGDYISPESTIPPAALTDGIPPATSPVVVTIGAQGVIFVKWEGVLNADPVTYQVHVSDDPAHVFVADDPDTLLTLTDSTMISARTTADEVPFDYGVDYYFCVIATDADGAGPVPATSAASQMNQTVNADLVADAIDGMTITGAVIRTASSGRRMQFDTIGMRSFDSGGAETSRLTAQTGGLELAGNLDLTGIGALLRTGLTGQRVEIDDDGVRGYASADNPVATATAGSGSANGIATFQSGRVIAQVRYDGGPVVRAYTSGLGILENINIVEYDGTICAGTGAGADFYLADSSALLLRGFTYRGVPVGTPFAITSPVGVAAEGNPTPNVYILDSAAKLVKKYLASSGALLTSWSTVGVPNGIAIVGSTVYVIDVTAKLVRTFSLTGTAGPTLSTTGVPAKIAASAHYIAYGDDTAKLIRIHDATTFAAIRTIPYYLFNAGDMRGLAIDSTETYLYVEADGGGQNIQQYYLPSEEAVFFNTTVVDGKQTVEKVVADQITTSSLFGGAGGMSIQSATDLSIIATRSIQIVSRYLGSGSGSATGTIDLYADKGITLGGTNPTGPGLSLTAKAADVLIQSTTTGDVNLIGGDDVNITASDDVNVTATDILLNGAVQVNGVPYSSGTGKEPAITGTTAADFWGGDKVFHNLGAAIAAYLDSEIITPTLANISASATETIVATWALPANYLTTGQLLHMVLDSQVSALATIIWKIRLGTLGTTADPVVLTFDTSPANTGTFAHAMVDAYLKTIAAGSSGTARGFGFATNGIDLGDGVGPVNAVNPTTVTTVNTTVAQKLTIAAKLSTTNNLTTNVAAMSKVRG